MAEIGGFNDDPPVPRDSEVNLASAESTHQTVNGVRLHVITAGNPSDPLVVLLHGFPEFWYAWNAYLEPLVDAGYHVLAPDQRGYNLSQKPNSVRSYRLRELSQDIAALIQTHEHNTAHVVGHDWGAGVAWDLALRHPSLVDRLGIMNVPHPTVFTETLRSNLTQIRKSIYMLYFQLPRLPEWHLKRTQFQPWVDAMRDQAKPGTFTDHDFTHYQAAWNQPRAPRSMLNWYRALLRYRQTPPQQQVEPPTLLLWGEQDQTLVPEMAPKNLEYCTASRLELVPDATHWINHEQPTQNISHLLDHFDH